MFTWPTELDNGPYLLSLIGSFWSDTFQGNDLVLSLLHARAQVAAQEDQDFQELLASVARRKVPVFHKTNWHKLTLFQSQLNQAGANYPHFDGSYLFDGTLTFDQPVGSAFSVWQLPTNLADVRVITSAITNSQVNWVQGVDFFLQGGAVWFRQNPFSLPGVSTRQIFDNGVVIDQACDLWLYAASWDTQNIYNQFGYALGLKLPSSQAYKDLVNAVYDALVRGTTEMCLRRLFASVAGAPVAQGSETVQHLLTDKHKLWIITDQNAYGFNPSSTSLVKVGDSLQEGDPLVDTAQLFEFNRGQVPDVSSVRALAVGKGLLAQGYFQDLVFENKIVPLVVDTSGDFTKVSFTLGGMPTDVTKFWDDVHNAGVAQGQTLAMLLDQRPAGNQDNKPTAAALPATINPLGFLLQNVFRNNLFVVKLRTSVFGDDAVGMAGARLLRRLVPPQTACLILIELEYDGDVIQLDQPGNETQAGYVEEVNTYVGNTIVETMVATDYIKENVRCFQLGGRCQ